MWDVQDQGGCGSCWAVSAATVIRAHLELYQRDQKLAPQQIVSCTANPRHCGGKGGCDGATGELAMDYVWKNGLAEEQDMSYEARDVTCPTSLKPQDESKLRGA